MFALIRIKGEEEGHHVGVGEGKDRSGHPDAGPGLLLPLPRMLGKGEVAPL